MSQTTDATDVEFNLVVPENSYEADLLSIIDVFQCELCHVCGGDLDGHMIGPGPFGKPQVWCLKNLEGTDENPA